jgi:DNA-binding LytR/AlgR family response regulator
MHPYNCIIVEDEPLAAGVLQDYIQQVPFLQLACTCSDAIMALDVLQKEKIDLVFLDIHLPKLKGLDFIKTLKTPPQIIITTAYHEYALKGYELNVLDYLLKPIEFSRFLSAVNKLQVKTERVHPAAAENSNPGKESLFFTVGNKKVRIFPEEILYIESVKEYIRVVTKNKSIITKFQLGQAEDMLSKHNFIRIHRSFIVAKDKIEAITATDVEISNKHIPVGRSYKEIVQAMMDK